VFEQNVTLLECHLCHGPLRRVKSDGSPVYVNGDRTTTPVEGRSRCGCGFKHYWNGREYDNMPERWVYSDSNRGMFEYTCTLILQYVEKVIMACT